MQKYPLKGFLLFLALLFSGSSLSSATSKKETEKTKSQVTEEVYITDDELDLFMLGGIISKTHKDFFKQATDPKSIILLKEKGKLKAFKVGNELSAKIDSRTRKCKIHHIYNKYHIKLAYKEGSKEKLINVVKVGFSNKRAKIPKQKKKKEKKRNIKGKYSEEGLERDFDGSTGKISLTQSKRDEIKNKLNEILMQASTTPIVEHEEIIGFMIDDIESGSWFEKAGFENGDIITSIKGLPLTNAATAIRILNTLKEADEVNYEFIRKGQNYEVSVTID